MKYSILISIFTLLLLTNCTKQRLSGKWKNDGFVIEFVKDPMNKELFLAKVVRTEGHSRYKVGEIYLKDIKVEDKYFFSGINWFYGFSSSSPGSWNNFTGEFKDGKLEIHIDPGFSSTFEKY